jgi:hypothetical protein
MLVCEQISKASIAHAKLPVMEKLISHLQETLDEDEAAKEALLQLKSNTGAGNQTQPNQTEVLGKRARPLNLPLKCSTENGNTFLFEIITSSLLKQCESALDLPIKIASMKLDVPANLLGNICVTQNVYNDWSPNFLRSLDQLVQIYELALEHGVCVASTTQRGRLASLKSEIAQVRQAPRGAGRTRESVPDVSIFIWMCFCAFLQLRSSS